MSSSNPSTLQVRQGFLPTTSADTHCCSFNRAVSTCPELDEKAHTFLRNSWRRIDNSMIASADYAGAGSDLGVHGRSPERGTSWKPLCVSLICDLCRTPAVKSSPPGY